MRTRHARFLEQRDQDDAGCGARRFLPCRPTPAISKMFAVTFRKPAAACRRHPRRQHSPAPTLIVNVSPTDRPVTTSCTYLPRHAAAATSAVPAMRAPKTLVRLSYSRHRRCRPRRPRRHLRRCRPRRHRV